MPPAAIEFPTPTDHCPATDEIDLANLDSPSRLAESVDCLEGLRQRSRGTIEKAVVQIRNADELIADYRWQPRVAFVRPARISFPRARSNRQGEICNGACPGSDVSVDVVTTDLSPKGAGILSYSSNDPLPQNVTLSVDGTEFDCEVRWSTRIGGRVYRYGLLFRDVRGSTDD